MKEYSPDRPIESEDEDLFNRSAFAGRVASTISLRTESSSLVLSIFGRWGDGKTSTLNLMKRALRNNENVVIVSFNPWHFATQEQLLRGFFSTLADALDKTLKSKAESIGEALKKYGGLLSLASLSLGGVVSVSPGAAAGQLGAGLSTVELDEVRQRVEDILRQSGKRTVVFIDDIDRLDREEIHAIFKLVKLSASFPSTIYVLAFDDDIVAAALGEKYGSGGIDAGRQFLEKIIQVPLHLPPADRITLRAMAFRRAEEALKLADISVSEEVRQEFPYHFTEGLEARLSTPRQVVRYANALTFAMPILKGEVNPHDQMLIEGIRVVYPRLYRTIREHPDCFLLRHTERREESERLRIKDTITAGLEGLKPGDQDAALSLLRALFPRLNGVFGNMGYAPSIAVEWAQKQKICSEFYFDRYFTYAVSDKDVADRAVDSLIALATASDGAAVQQAFEKLAAPATAERFMARLRLREEAISAPAAMTLLRIVAKRGAIYPTGAGVFADSAFDQAAILLTRLLQRLPAGDGREDAAIEAMGISEPLTFAIEYFRWLGVRGENAQIISAEGERRAAEILVSRLREDAATDAPYIRYPDQATRALWIWKTYGPDGDISRYLSSRLERDPSEVAKLLVVFTPRPLGVAAGSERRDLGRDQYDFITKIIDPEAIQAAVQAVHGNLLATATEEYERSYDIDEDLRIARQFTYLHRDRVKIEAATVTAPESRALGETSSLSESPAPLRSRPRRRRRRER